MPQIKSDVFTRYKILRASKLIKPNFTCAFILLAALSTTQANAASCDDNFTVSGSFFSGKTYKTWANLSAGKFESAYKGAYLSTLKEGWKILKLDKELGIISAAQAVQYAKGKLVPLTIAIEKSDAATKISLTYSTPAGLASPEDAVKLGFCNTVVAADMMDGDVSVAAKPAPPTSDSAALKALPAKQEQENIISTEFVKNGMPCLNGICIGDEASSLNKIKWPELQFGIVKEPVRKMKVSETELQRFIHEEGFLSSANSADAIRSAFPFLSMKKFDNDAIPKLMRLPGKCKPSALLVNSFKSESGFATDVTIAIVPSNDGLSQVMKVVNIRRIYSEAYTAEQIKELGAQFKQRYAGIPDNTNSKYSPVRWSFIAGMITLTGMPGMWAGNQELFKLYPGCGKELKVD